MIRALLDWLVEWQTVLSLALLGFILLGALLTGLTTIGGLESSRRQTEKVLVLEREAADARTAQKNAEKSLLEFQHLIKERRTIDEKRGAEILNSGPKGTVTIEYAMQAEPAQFAQELDKFLRAQGWAVSAVLGSPEGGAGLSPGINMRLHGEKGVVTKNWENVPEPGKTLHRFFANAVSGNPTVTTEVLPNMTAEFVWIMVAPKY
jgi:hypothetical protein